MTSLAARLAAAGLLLLLLAACASGPPPPDWQGGARSALDAAVQAHLLGDTRVEQAEMARARAEVARTAKLSLAARTELVLCAAQVASLELEGCPAYSALARDAGPSERAYAAYLYGNAGPMDVPLLPVQHQGIALQRTTAISALTDPLSRLVAAAVLLQQGRLDPAALAVAVETASAHGWRRPLLAWLGLQLKAAEQAGQKEEIERIRRRMGLVAPR